MNFRLGGLILCGVLLGADAVHAGGAVTPDAGPLEGHGRLRSNDGAAGAWSVRATLQGGNFTGEATASIGGVSLSGPLLSGRSYLENGKCYFALERDRARASFGGPCTTDGISGRLDGFLPGRGLLVGTMEGALRFGRAGAAPVPAPAPTPTPVPAAGGLLGVKLTCAWWETRVSFRAGELNSRELRFSNMVTLTLLPDGTYRTASSGGNFVREGNRIRLTSGAFAGAIGQLRPDRSGEPAVYFERDENRRPDGVHIVDPATTACTRARS